MASRKKISLDDLEPFSERDFEAFQKHKWSDPEYNPERLRLKRKLATVGEPLRAAVARAGEKLVLRTSIHNPYVFNGNRVDSLWLYLSPADAAKKPLRDLLGVEFQKDTDASYVHANLVVEIDGAGLEAGLRINQKAWWDTQNIKGRCSRREGAEELANLLNQVGEPYALIMHDWQRTWPCGQLAWDDIMEFLRYFEPGTHRLRLVRRIERGDPLATSAGLFPELAREFEKLVPVYRFVLWSPDNNHLGMKAG